MKNEPTRSRVMLLLPDGFDYRLTHRYLDSMPNTRRIMEEGYSAQVLPFASTWGNINFASLCTGAPPGTHYRHEPQPDPPSSMMPPGCAAETLWQALGAEGRRSALIDLGQSYPPGTDMAGVVAPSDSRGEVRAALFGPRVHQTPDVHTGVGDGPVVERTGWPPGRGPTANRAVQQAPAPVERAGRLETTLALAEGVEWRAVIARGEGAAFGRMLVHPPGGTRPPAEATPGRWTDWIEGTARGQRFKVRFRLLHLAEDGRSFALLASAGCAVDALSDPPELGEMLLSRLGPYGPGTAIPPHPDDPDHGVGMDEMVESARWVIGAAELAFREWNAELFMHKSYVADSASHQCAAHIDPTYHRYDPAQAERFDRVLRRAYADLDGVIGHMLEVASSLGNTNVIVAGDHGICINNVVCDINRRLQQVGLAHLREDGAIDMDRSLAYTKRSRQGNEVFVNLRGREGTGVVAPADYVEIQERIIDALLDWRAPQGTQRAVCFALKKRETPILGYWGAECGDVLFAYNQGFTWGVNLNKEPIALSTTSIANHGAGIQTQDTGVTSNMGMLLVWGPKVNAGVRRDTDRYGPVPIHHIAPTVARLLGCQVPRHATGRVIQDLLC